MKGLGLAQGTLGERFTTPNYNIKARSIRPPVTTLKVVTGGP